LFKHQWHTHTRNRSHGIDAWRVLFTRILPLHVAQSIFGLCNLCLCGVALCLDIFVVNRHQYLPTGSTEASRASQKYYPIRDLCVWSNRFKRNNRSANRGIATKLRSSNCNCLKPYLVLGLRIALTVCNGRNDRWTCVVLLFLQYGAHEIILQSNTHENYGE